MLEDTVLYYFSVFFLYGVDADAVEYIRLKDGNKCLALEAYLALAEG